MSWFGSKKSANPLDLEQVKDRATFLAFMDALQADLQANEGDWENTQLPDFLQAMQAWATDWQHFERNPNPWRHAAELLMAARVYE